VAAQTSPRFLGWCGALLMAKQEQPAAPPMTLGNMREQGPLRGEAASLRVDFLSQTPNVK